ncbi:prolyl oligopeptidase family serine peptidase [Arthrobacter sp.]|uniref:S9 family peptidase n=1 Tax=Arthrobacter sp. TaxID=1667 RepID=UPI003A908599
MKPDQLELLTTVSAPALSPDGSRAVFAASHPSFDADSGVGQLWILEPGADGSGSAPRRLTRGSSDAAPRFSPDGRIIAFLRPDEKGRMQLAIVDARGGEPRLVTNRHLGVSGFTFSPDSRRVAFTSRTPAEGRYGTVEGIAAGAEDPRRITGFKYRFNGLGFGNDKRAGIHLLELPDLDAEPFIQPVGRAAKAAADAAGGQAETPTGEFPPTRLITPADRDCTNPEFGPDGAHVYFTAALHEGADRDLRSMIHRVRVAGLDTSGTGGPEVEPVAGTATGSTAYDDVRFSRDGSSLFLLGSELGETGIDFVARSGAIHVLAADAIGSEQPRRLTDPETVDYTENDALVPFGTDGIAALARVRGASEVHVISATGGAETLVSGHLEVGGVAEEAGVVVLSYSDPTTPGEIGIPANGGVKALTDFAAGLREQTRIAVPRELEVESADGYPVHGWMFLPEGPGPHPVLLNIHGGPYAQYGWGYFDEAQVYARAGYAVLQCNPRGSASYGRAHGLAIKEAMGTVDLQDVLAFLDGAIASEPMLDGARTGVLGGSYGGYLTAWTIAHEHRFAAAIVERGYLDPLSFTGTSDIGWFFSEEYTGRDVAATLAQSPMAKVSQVRTPTLVLHSEEDYRCPLEQAQRYYVELLRHGVEAEFLLFPGENHELSRGGTPWHRRQRFEAILEWWGRYLPVDAQAGNDDGAPVAASA